MQAAETTTDYITNGSFEDGLEGWNPNGIDTEEKEGSAYPDNGGTKSAHFWNCGTAKATYSCTQTISSLPAGTYKLSFWSTGGKGEKEMMSRQMWAGATGRSLFIQ